MANFTLVLGGAASGKSAFAEKLLFNETAVTYIATLAVKDKEMQAKVKLHKQRRPAHWRTVEVIKPNLATVIKKQNGNCLLIDDFGVYVAQLLDAKKQPRRHLLNVLKALTAYEGQIIGVSQEVGWGIVPVFSSARQFRELLGWLNQQLADIATQVFLVVAGQPVLVKNTQEV